MLDKFLPSQVDIAQIFAGQFALCFLNLFRQTILENCASFNKKNTINVLHHSTGIGLLLFQLLVYPLVERITGPVMISRIGAVCP